MKTQEIIILNSGVENDLDSGDGKKKDYSICNCYGPIVPYY
ncbi:MAG: hypothetical protein ACMUIU_11130 [bacterium]